MGSGVLARRQLWQTGAVGFTLALLLPVVLWHHVIGQIAGGFRLEPGYLITGWAPWLLMLGGLACFLPILADRLRDPERRFRAPMGAWYGWGVTLYLLGFLLATQVAQIAEGISAL
jgi:hypothetical protein